MKRILLGIGIILLPLVAVGAILFFGGYDIAASSGHWGLTRWALSTARDNSIAARRPAEVPADLEDMRRVRLGAGHFATVCEDCHGAPDRGLPAVTAAMTPPPPHFSTLGPGRSPEELFWIVRHGIKMSGMPAWPAQAREDEVASMVAFLGRSGEMTLDTYRDLAYGPGWPADDDPVLATCARCHGRDGNGREMHNLPVIAGQKPAYLMNALEAFRSGERHSGIMQAVATELTDADIDRLARHYGASPRTTTSPPPVDEIFERGQELALRGSADQKIPACSACHGPWPTRRNPYFPEIRGQPEGYIHKQLELFKNGNRGGSEYRHLMQPVAQALSEEDMAAVARYYSSLPPQD